MTQANRLIVLDTETTGLDPDTGDRIVEIGAVELIDDMPTGKKLHLYINPQRDMPKEAFDVHGLSTERLRNEPVFAEIAKSFIDFVGDSRMVIHNAKFDMKFINAELKRVGHDEYPLDRAIDTIVIAKRKFPTSPASLNALCNRFGISLENRELHGALKDADLLAEVWLGLNGGRQPEMLLASKEQTPNPGGYGTLDFTARQRPRRLADRISSDEAAAHDSVMQTINASALKASKNQSGAIWMIDTDVSPAP